MRLDKFLAHSGLGTRKEVKRYIHDKRITLNDKVVKSDSVSVNELTDIVCFDGKKVIYKEFYYILLNKPQGYVSAVNDNVYPPVLDLVQEFDFVDLFPVGRLDVDTTGVLLLTNDGELCHKLISPKYEVDKTYFVEVDKALNKSLVKSFNEGIMLDDELTLPSELNILDSNHALLTIHQGKFHQVKRMFKKFGYEVVKLDRKSFGFLSHEDLEIGEYRELTSIEETKLKKLVE